MYGYVGKYLVADLSNKTFEVRDLDPQWARDYIGGAALGARILYDLMPAHTPVFDEKSVIGLVSGPTNATKALMGGRFSVVSKSPVTNGWNDASAGGLFGPTMRKAGFDAIFIKDISEKPCYILLKDGVPEFRDASHLWGKLIAEVHEELKKEVGDDRISTALIGPGGEHLSNMAGVFGDARRAAGRGGSGAVMGSKKLKGVVALGTKDVEVADDKTLMEINKSWADHAKGMGAVPVGKFRATGTTSDYDSSVFTSDAGIKNWAGTPDMLTDDMVNNLTGRVMDPLYRGQSQGCHNCPVKCGAFYHIKTDKFKTGSYDITTTRPEYETLGAFGSNLLCGDSEVVNICNWYCNEYGYDTLSFGGTLAWLMECYEKGILTKDDLDGLEMKWGDGDDILAMTKKICDYEGVGVPLNLASRGAARYFGKGFECLCTASGIEIPQHGSRYNPGLARTFQYDPTPGRHVKPGMGVPYGHSPAEVKYNYEGTGQRDKAGTREWEFNNMTGFCSFCGFLLGPGAPDGYINAITGFGLTEEDWVELGLRAFTMRDAFNLREGFRRKDWDISDRLVGKPAFESGPLAGVTVDNEKLADNFYEAMGWDVETGMPPKEFLLKMNMEFVAKDLYPEE